MNSKSIGVYDSTGSRKEDKASRLDGKQTRGPRKQIVELRLRQEREDLQKYLHELKDLRLESGSTRSYFRPLEFPKIAEFTQPGNLNKDCVFSRHKSIFVNNNNLYNYLSVTAAHRLLFAF